MSSEEFLDQYRTESNDAITVETVNELLIQAKPHSKRQLPDIKLITSTQSLVQGLK